MSGKGAHRVRNDKEAIGTYAVFRPWYDLSFVRVTKLKVLEVDYSK